MWITPEGWISPASGTKLFFRKSMTSPRARQSVSESREIAMVRDRVWSGVPGASDIENQFASVQSCW
jgi:hypothetical protein